MRTRPWPIVILAICHVLAPIPNYLISAWASHLSLAEYWRLLMASGAYEVFAFFGLIPLAGVAVYAMKPWSYPVCLALSGLLAHQNYLQWQLYPQQITFPILCALLVMNLSIVGYFLLPQVSAPYFNRKLRWWESQPRYEIDLKARAAGTWGKKAATIVNLSEGGAFIRVAAKLAVGAFVKLSFTVLDREFEIRGHVVRVADRGPKGYAMQFDLSAGNRDSVKDLVRALELTGHVPKNNSDLRFDDFKLWLHGMATSGRGLVPDSPMAPIKEPKLELTSTAAERRRKPRKHRAKRAA